MLSDFEHHKQDQKSKFDEILLNQKKEQKTLMKRMQEDKRTEVLKLQEEFILDRNRVIADKDKELLKAKTDCIQDGSDELKEVIARYESNKRDLKRNFEKELQEHKTLIHDKDLLIENLNFSKNGLEQQLVD